MATFKVVFEIEVDETSAIAAAQTVEGWLHDTTKQWQYYVQNTETNEISSIDLEEEDSDMELPVNNYTPLIK